MATVGVDDSSLQADRQLKSFNLVCSTLNSHDDYAIVTAPVWWSGVVVSVLVLINEVNLHRAWLVLRWATVSRFNSRCRTLISVRNQPATQGQLSLPSLRGR